MTFLQNKDKFYGAGECSVISGPLVSIKVASLFYFLSLSTRQWVESIT